MTSRLDRLVQLLSAGSNGLIRGQAAEQIAAIQSAQPLLLNGIISKLLPLVRSSQWSTRVAASEAMRIISKNIRSAMAEHVAKPVAHQDRMEVDYNETTVIAPPSSSSSSVSSSPQVSPSSDTPLLSLATFSTARVIAKGTLMLASSGSEYSARSLAHVPLADRIVAQRRQLLKRLGCYDEYGGVDQVLDEQDVAMEVDVPSAAAPSAASASSSTPSKELSAREKNKLKRELKRRREEDHEDHSDGAQGKRKKAKPGDAASSNSSGSTIPDAEDSILASVAVDESAPFRLLDGSHALKPLIMRLLWQLVDVRWETRHGAALALRSILLRHSDTISANLRSPLYRLRNLPEQPQHQSFLSDTCARILCVLILDRFGDFSGEEVSYPVREAAGQVLSLLASHLDDSSLQLLVRDLLEMATHQEADLRYGGFLGLKYVLTVRFSQIDALSHQSNEEMFRSVREPLIVGLRDASDDVRGLAGESLKSLVECIHHSPSMSEHLFNEAHQSATFDALRHALNTCDDLTASTAHIIELIRVLSETVKVESNYMELVQQLLPFVNHTVTLVRVNTWTAIHSLLNSTLSHDLSAATMITSLTSPLTTIFRFAYQGLIVDTSEQVHHCCFDIVRLFASTEFPSCHFSSLFLAIYPYSMELLHSPLFQPIPDRLLMKPLPYPSGMSDDAAMDAPISTLEVKLRISSAMGHLFHRLAQCIDHPKQPFDNLIDHLRSPHDLIVQMACLVVAKWWRICVNNPGSEKVAMETRWWNAIEGILQTSPSNRPRSANTNALAAEALIAACSLRESEGPLSLAVIQSCVQPLLFTLEHEGKFALLQERAAEYLIWFMTLPSTVMPILEVKRECNNGSTWFEDVFGRIVELACATLPREPLINAAPPTIPTTHAPPVKYEPIDDTPGTEEDLLAMLLDEDQEQKQPPDLRLSAVLPPAATSGLDAREIAARGGCLPLSELIKRQCTMDIFDRSPSLWNTYITSGLGVGNASSARDPYALMRSLQVLGSMMNGINLDPKPLHNNPHSSRWLSLIPVISQIILHPPRVVDEVVRDALVQLTRKVFMQYADHFTTPTLDQFVRTVIPVLESRGLSSSSTSSSTTASIPNDTVASKLQILDLLAELLTKLVPSVLFYLPFFVQPVLFAMSDTSIGVSNEQTQRIRTSASDIFGRIMALIPLEADLPPPEDMAADLQQERSSRRAVFEQLVDGSKVEEAKMPDGFLQPGMVLRAYQRDGIKWLRFLQKFHLHGVLCDEMGVGKTGQTWIAVALNLYERRARFRASSSSSDIPLPSLIVCPTTLVQHWALEADKFINLTVCPIKIVEYQGSTGEKTKIRNQFLQLSRTSSSTALDSDAILIMSYDSIRKDAHHFTDITFHHLILDEGHLIKNSSSQLCASIKSIRSLSRLLLSGTPLSNHVLELWSLFDFLLPGYLGTEAEFRKQYARPIQKARAIEIDKSTSKKKRREAEVDGKMSAHQATTATGNLALESLHRRVLPFMLRRCKKDVLAELPPKIIQDVFVDLSPLQLELYQLVAGEEEELERAATADQNGASSSAPSMHTFQALQYLRSLCSHPSLVLTDAHPQYERLRASYFPRGSPDSIHSLKHAPKLAALKELLLECGIGRVTSSRDDPSSRISSSKSNKKQTDVDLGELLSSESAVPRHRVLIFAQLKGTLDRIEQDLFKGGSPDGFAPNSVSFVRLDGSTPPQARFDVVRSFNSDPTIDCMLLTTSVGGLGLNLSTADTVIFIEHSYNPQQDEQAMDRVHRLGQSASVVNIYRLLTRHTLEERIMSLQRFKLHMSRTVTNAENSTMRSMDTGGVIERLERNGTTMSRSTAPTSEEDDAPDSAQSMDAFLRTYRERK